MCFICAHTHTHTHTHQHTHKYTHINTCTNTHIHTHINMRTNTHTHKHTHTLVTDTYSLTHNNYQETRCSLAYSPGLKTLFSLTQSAYHTITRMISIPTVSIRAICVVCMHTIFYSVQVVLE